MADFPLGDLWLCRNNQISRNIRARIRRDGGIRILQSMKNPHVCQAVVMLTSRCSDMANSARQRHGTRLTSCATAPTVDTVGEQSRNPNDEEFDIASAIYLTARALRADTDTDFSAASPSSKYSMSFVFRPVHRHARHPTAAVRVTGADNFTFQRHERDYGPEPDRQPRRPDRWDFCRASLAMGCSGNNR